MVISDAEKKVLLERLEKARIAKQAKAAEAKKAKEAKEAKEAPTPAPAPAPEPIPEPIVEEKPPVSEPIDIPAPPDLVRASRKPAKKVVLPDSDSDEEEVVMPKKTKGKAVRGTGKEVPYMKIKLYKEPSNPVAFQQLLEAVNDNGGEYEEEEQEQAPPPPAPFVKGARVLQKVGIAPKRGAASSLTAEDVKAAELKRLALEIFG
jgi:hypothetical protein